MPLAEINGTTLFYKMVGEGAPCLVMHGGLGVDHHFMHPFLDSLGDAFQLVYYDHRGNGQSGRPGRETLTHAQLAADADALAEHLGLGQVTVLGHSYGGVIALELALRYPQRVSRLVLLDTTSNLQYGPSILENARRKGATDEMMAVLQGDGANDDEAVAEHIRTILPLYFHHFDAQAVHKVFRDCVFSAEGVVPAAETAAYNILPRLGEIRVPTLILVGDDDFICPPSQARLLHEGIQGSQLEILEGCGHIPHVEAPEAFFRGVRRWIAGQALSSD